MFTKRKKYIHNIRRYQILSAILVSLFIITIAMFIFLPMSLKQVALALNNSYSKGPSDSLSASEWNLLDDDFVKKEGDTMTGPLILPPTQAADSAETAATKGYVDTITGGTTFIKATDGADLKMVCGESTGIWVDYGTCEMYTIVDTTNINTGNPFFANPPIYLTSIEGDNYLSGILQGENAIYVPDNSGFVIYLKTQGSPSCPTWSDANSSNWRVKWCGIGN